MDIKIMVEQLIKFFLIIVLGYSLFKLKIMDEAFDKKLTKLVLYVTMPCMILASVLKETGERNIVAVSEVGLVAAALYFVILPLLGLLFAFLMRAKKRDFGLFAFMTVFSNIGFMGFPLIDALYPNGAAMLYTAIFNLVFNIVIYTIGVKIIGMGNDTAKPFSFRLILSPGVVLSVVAIILYFLAVKVPAFVTDTVNSIGNITSPAAMLLVGANLARMKLKDVFNDIRVYPYALIRQIVLPLIIWIPLNFILKDRYMLNVILVMLAMPVANNAVLFATEYSCDEELAAKTVFITTLMSLFTLPLITAVTTFLSVNP